VDCEESIALACGLRRMSLVRASVDGTRPWPWEVGRKAHAARMVGECLGFGGSLPMLELDNEVTNEGQHIHHGEESGRDCGDAMVSACRPCDVRGRESERGRSTAVTVVDLRTTGKKPGPARPYLWWHVRKVRSRMAASG
jgi:hypothetical protein